MQHVGVDVSMRNFAVVYYKLPAYALKSAGCCLQIAFCIGQSIATSITVWNRAFLFV